MRLSKLIAAAALATGITTGAAHSAQAATAVQQVEVGNGTWAWIGIINYADSNHNTRATALPVGIGDTADIWVPADTGGGTSFVVIYGNTCLAVPGQMNSNWSGSQVSSDNGFTLLPSTKYDAWLGVGNDAGGSLFLSQDNHTPANDVYVGYGAAAASCSGR